MSPSNSTGENNKRARIPTKHDSFRVLNELQIPVSTVIDVGVLTCTAELMENYPKTPHILVEPIAEFEERIRQRYDKSEIDYTLIQRAASNHDGEVRMRTISLSGTGQITHSQMEQATDKGGEYRSVQCTTIDSLVAEQAADKPFLLKIDVDGAELLVLEGAKNTLKKCSVICVEAVVTNMFERAEAITQHGFHLFDVVDFCYHGSKLYQLDMIFLNTNMAREIGVNPGDHPVVMERWYNYSKKI